MHYLKTEPAAEIPLLLNQWAVALWLEERTSQAIAVAVAKAFNGDR